MRRVHDVVLHGTIKAKAVLVEDLRLPIHICLGNHEAATEEEINELISDLTHELARR